MKTQSLRAKIKDTLAVDEIFHDNEVQGNILGGIILFNSGLILGIILLLTYLGFFPLGLDMIGTACIQGMIEVALLVVIARIVKDDRWWLKYLLILGMILVYARLDSMLTHKAAILMVIPIVYSSRYFSRRLTIITSITTTIIFMLSSIWGATHGMINLNIVTMPEGVEMVTTGGFLGDTIINAGVTDEMLINNTLLFDYVPKWFMFSIVTVISANIAKRGRNMVIQKYEQDVKNARIESELTLANRIQASMLPHIFPAFPERPEFDLYASMDPAKEVGGDFYDYFLIDDDHLCMIMADVSGKGVPAALFMMASKIILASNAKQGKSPREIIESTNNTICADNKEEMFVTVWLGILEISTGKLVATNAGHEYPVIKHADGQFEIVKQKHGFVVGGMQGIKYQEYEVILEPGSKIFLYTDGVPEATNQNNDMFGMDRLIDALNEDPTSSPEEILTRVKTAVDTFTDAAMQFDDITMLCAEYKGDKR